jgi:hypothetical protein
MIQIGEPVRTRIRNAIIVIMTIGVFGLLFTKPVLPPWWRANATDLICMIAVIGFSLILLYNKLVCGVFFPGPPKNVDGHPRS